MPMPPVPDETTPAPRSTRALVLSGGVALGAFEAGACAALEEAEATTPDWVVGVSIGAVNAAIFAGNPPGQRTERLRRFWESVATDPMPVTSFWLGNPPAAGVWRRNYNRASVIETLLFGRPGLFRPRLLPQPELGDAPALYDLEPLRARLTEMVDFARLNSGGMRLSIVATDVVSGERVVFDTARDTRIGPEHLAASCALLPVFAPLEVEGRLLGDGGLASNAPLDLVLDDPEAGDVVCFLIELFARRGSRPRSLIASLSRAGDLAFGNQTERMLEARQRERHLRALLDRLAARIPPELRASPEIAEILAEVTEVIGARAATLLRLGYRAAQDEAGPGKAFDFSRATVAERWQAGARAMREALRRLEAPAEAASPGLVLHEIEDGPDGQR